MKTSIISKLVCIGILSLLLVSCDDFLDVNTDPNSPSVVPENLQLGGLLGNFSYEIIGNQPARVPALWIQQLAWNGVPPTQDNYQFTESDANNLWAFFGYSDVLKNARDLNSQAETNGNYAYAGISKVITAWTLSILTDLWNDIPLSQAFDPTNTEPGYDTQEQVYEEIFRLLSAAREDFDRPSPISPANDDLLYRGDMEKWRKLTNVLTARFHLRLSKAPGNSAQTRAQNALNAAANGFASNADDANFNYPGTAGMENPWFQFAIDGKWDRRDQLSNHYVELLKSLNDPRLPIQARPVGEVPTTGSLVEVTEFEYAGHMNGEDGIGTGNISSIGRFYSNPNAPLTWLSYAELKFIEAEALLLSSGPAAADPVFRDAVRASMDKLGVGASARDDYVATLPALDAANALEQIMIQKYIANFLNPEAYNDWRRNNYPVLTPVTNLAQLTVVPRRFPYPISEYQYNAANVNATGVPVGRNSMAMRVWWDTGN